MARPRFGESDQEFDARAKARGRRIGYFLLILLLAMCGAILYPVWQSSRALQVVQAQSNVKQLGLGLLMYANDENDSLPRAEAWMDAVQPYILNEPVFHSPSLKPPAEYGFAFRRHLGGEDISKVVAPDQVAMVFDSTDLRRNATGELDLLPNPPRYHRAGTATNVVAFVDGHAIPVPRAGTVLR